MRFLKYTVDLGAIVNAAWIDTYCYLVRTGQTVRPISFGLWDVFLGKYALDGARFLDYRLTALMVCLLAIHIICEIVKKRGGERSDS